MVQDCPWSGAVFPDRYIERYIPYPFNSIPSDWLSKNSEARATSWWTATNSVIFILLPTSLVCLWSQKVESSVGYWTPRDFMLRVGELKNLCHGGNMVLFLRDSVCAERAPVHYHMIACWRHIYTPFSHNVLRVCPYIVISVCWRYFHTLHSCNVFKVFSYIVISIIGIVFHTMFSSLFSVAKEATGTRATSQHQDRCRFLCQSTGLHGFQ